MSLYMYVCMYIKCMLNIRMPVQRCHCIRCTRTLTRRMCTRNYLNNAPNKALHEMYENVFGPQSAKIGV
jgi:hypothetical protein